MLSLRQKLLLTVVVLAMNLAVLLFFPILVVFSLPPSLGFLLLSFKR